jgi:CPA2 family monovalent cation:H+ antiporter-2
MALDLDPERVREASRRRAHRFYGDAARREALLAAGLMRASVVVVTFADIDAALRVIHRVRELRPDVAIVARARDEERLREALRRPAPPRWCRRRSNPVMLATRTPWRCRGADAQGDQAPARNARAALCLLRGFFHGATDAGATSPTPSSRACTR